MDSIVRRQETCVMTCFNDAYFSWPCLSFDRLIHIRCRVQRASHKKKTKSVRLTESLQWKKTETG